MADKAKNYAKMKLQNEAQIDASIVSIEKRSKTLQEDIHRTATSILYVWQSGGPKKAQFAADRLNKLQASSPYHSNAFSKWVGMFTSLLWSDEKNEWYAPKGARIAPKQFTEARDTPFWKVSPPPAAKPFDMFADLQRIIDKARKHAEKPVDGDVISNETVNVLVDIVSKHVASNS